ncbi:MAG: hypothetical protein IRZ15_06390 [Bryobacteraceae bacterium]|nr:hypothetical protein [Bryobacteraceae bacterium]
MRLAVVLVLMLLPGILAAQDSSAATSSEEESFRVYTEAPRLFLNARRLRLLKRERERESIRWQQFELLMTGGAAMPEPGFANALFYRVTGDAQAARRAIEWALTSDADIRQQAIVYDWCSDALTAPQSESLRAKLTQSLERTAQAADLPTVRSRALAAIALAGEDADLAERVLRGIVLEWWRSSVSQDLKRGRVPFQPDDTLALLELLHATRDNLKIDLRDSAPRFFKNLPAFELLRHYPSPWPAAENEYRIPMYSGKRDPDIRQSVLARAAELALVAYDANATEHQFVQGWLIHDRFLMRSPFGIPYEFLWANPYQPGLSYSHMPLSFHDPEKEGGVLLARSTWDEDASWFGYVDGQIQSFTQGRRTELSLEALEQPLRLGSIAVTSRLDLTVGPEAPEMFYFIGLKPRASYEVEVEGEEKREEQADAGGILALKLPLRAEKPVRIRVRPRSSNHK